MKKVLLLLLGAMFITSSAFAASMGVSGQVLLYDASGTETVKSSSQKNEKDENGAVPVVSFFIETETDAGVVGLDVVPYGAKVADFSNARDDTDTDDAADNAGTNKGDINFKNHMTLYFEKPIAAADGAFVKFGVHRVTIETDEEVATGSTYGDEHVMGLMIGFGKKTMRDTGHFVKVEGQVSRYQGATFDGSADTNSVKNKIELYDFTTAALKISVGKEF